MYTQRNALSCIKGNYKCYYVCTLKSSDSHFSLVLGYTCCQWCFQLPLKHLSKLLLIMSRNVHNQTHTRTLIHTYTHAWQIQYIRTRTSHTVPRVIRTYVDYMKMLFPPNMSSGHTINYCHRRSEQKIQTQTECTTEDTVMNAGHCTIRTYVHMYVHSQKQMILGKHLVLTNCKHNMYCI